VVQVGRLDLVDLWNLLSLLYLQVLLDLVVHQIPLVQFLLLVQEGRVDPSLLAAQLVQVGLHLPVVPHHP
jgi:hypothetical protein